MMMKNVLMAGARIRALSGLACALIGIAALSTAQAALPVQSWTAKTGTKVLFVEARSIPMIDLRVDFDAGSRYDPPAKAGLAAMTQGLLALGANVQNEVLTEQQIADRFADAGAQRGGSAPCPRAPSAKRH